MTELRGQSRRAGFTGRSSYCTDPQSEALRALLAELRAQGFRWLDHGDCVGADALAHHLATDIGYRIKIHPPENERLRACCKGALIVEDVKPYIERNHDIVDDTEILIAVPSSMHEVLRSGTWATVRYARKQGRLIIIVWPDGTVTREGNGNEDE